MTDFVSRGCGLLGGIAILWSSSLFGGCTDKPTDDDSSDAGDDDTVATDDDSSAAGDDDDLTPVELSECLTDLSCEYVFSCGHRGAMYFAPENTLVGFDLALEMGMDSIELDVRPTSDEVLVLMHDSTLDRTTNGTGSVSEMTLAEVQQLVAVSEFDGIPDQPIPTFAEALEHLRGRAIINVDAKTGRMDLIGADIVAAEMQRWAFIQVDDEEEGEAVRAVDPTLLVEIDAETVEEVGALAATLAPEIVQFPWQLDEPGPVEAAVVAGARPSQNALGALDIGATLLAGAGDDPCPAYQPMWELGITYIQTDTPDLLAPCLEEVNAASGYAGPVESS